MLTIVINKNPNPLTKTDFYDRFKNDRNENPATGSFYDTTEQKYYPVDYFNINTNGILTLSYIRGTTQTAFTYNIFNTFTIYDSVHEI